MSAVSGMLGDELLHDGCRVRVLPGRSLDTFSSGQTGEVVHTHPEANNCDVLFDGRHDTVLVACRHLRVTCPAPGGFQDAMPEEPLPLASQKEHSSSSASDKLQDRTELEDEPGAVTLLGPLEAAYDGLSKWKGCALASDGCLYCAPYGASSVLVINPSNQSLTHIEDVGCGEYKWSGIAAGVDGALYCAPCNASTVLVIDPKTGQLDHIEGAGDGEYKWSGIAAASDGLLYCAPSRASTVLVIDPRSRLLSHITGAGSGGSKWSGICEGVDGRLYCAPSMATAVLQVNPATKSLTRLEGALDGSSFKYKWSGVARGCNGMLYCSPYNASSILVIDPMTESLNYIEGAGSGDCKWSGVAPGLDGRLYCVPSRASMILVIDPMTGSLDFDFKDVGRGHSKWSGLCVGLDRCLYCVPYNSSLVLTIKGGRKAAAGPTRSCPEMQCLVNRGDPHAEEKQAVVEEFQQMFKLPPEQRVTRYRELCRCWHPDKNPSDPDRATAVFQFLQQLHERIGDLRRR